MRNRIFAFILVFVSAASLFTACKKATPKETTPLSDPAIVGTWEGTDNGLSYTYIFNLDGSGETLVAFNDESELFPFDWKTSDTTLSLTFPEGEESYTQELQYEIQDKVLTLKKGENVLTLTKK